MRKVKVLIGVDLQNDCGGALGTQEARNIIPKVKAKVGQHERRRHRSVYKGYARREYLNHRRQALTCKALCEEHLGLGNR